MKWSRSFISLPLLLALSACGDTWGERAVTGGGMGAGTGLAIGAVVGWPLLVPVLVGTAVGAGIGAATTPNKDSIPTTTASAGEK
jgi:osmotically inducible lipoprotein OsmB